MDFDVWLNELNRLAQEDGATDKTSFYSDQTGVECWLDLFELGYTPEDAWAEERTALPV